MQVNITKRIDTPEGKRYCPVVVGPNGRIKPDWVIVNDRQEKHPEGAYYLDWNEDGKRRRMSVGNDAAAAYNSLKKAKRAGCDRGRSRCFRSRRRRRLPPSYSGSGRRISRGSSTHQAKKNMAGILRLPRYLHGVLLRRPS